MSKPAEKLIKLAEQSPETKIMVPLIRVILMSPEKTFSAFHSLVELWSRLKGDQRAILAIMIDNSLKVQQAAHLAGVNRRTLYKSRHFQRVYAFIRANTAGSPPRDSTSPDDSDDS